MDKNARIYVAGHLGMIGTALTAALQAAGHHHLLLRSRAELDLTDQAATARFFAETRPDYVLLAAAKVGGIQANHTRPAEFITENLLIETNVVQNCHRHGVKRLLFIGSSCTYPRDALQPMPESCLFSGPMEPTSEAFSMAKAAGITLVRSYNRQYGRRDVVAMLNNNYGPHDYFHPDHSHVIPGLIRKFHTAKMNGLPVVTLWGSGAPLRAFLHTEDMARACLLLMQLANPPEVINIGHPKEIAIRDLAPLVAAVVGYQGAIAWDADKPDGAPRKLLDLSRITALGWQPRIALADGLHQTYQWFLTHQELLARQEQRG